MAWVCVAAGVLTALPAQAQIGPVRDRIYPAPHAVLTADGVPHAQLIQVTTSDALTLQGLSVPGRADMPVILLLHGNGSSARDSALWLSPALAQGYGLIAAEYRGYSSNPGVPDEAGLARDADAFMAETQALAGSRPIWIVGHSLGGGVALALANRHSAQVLITIGTFTRLRDVVPGPVRVAIPDAYRNIDQVPTLTQPWYIIHGTADPIVPASHGSRLHALAGQNQRQGASFVIPQADHAPDGETLAALFSAIRAQTDTNGLTADSVPEPVLVIPFGQSRPLARPTDGS